jgi:hypothetical protein
MRVVSGSELRSRRQDSSLASEITLGEVSARTRLEIADELISGVFRRELHGDHERPRHEASCLWRLPSVVRCQSSRKIGRQPDVVASRISTAPNDVDDALAGHARRRGTSDATPEFEQIAQHTLFVLQFSPPETGWQFEDIAPPCRTAPCMTAIRIERLDATGALTPRRCSIALRARSGPRSILRRSS